MHECNHEHHCNHEGHNCGHGEHNCHGHGEGHHCHNKEEGHNCHGGGCQGKGQWGGKTRRSGQKMRKSQNSF